MTSVFSEQTHVILCPASFCTLRPNLPVNMYSCIEKVKVLVAQLCFTLCDPMVYTHQAAQSIEFSGKNTELGSCYLLQGILYLY